MFFNFLNFTVLSPLALFHPPLHAYDPCTQLLSHHTLFSIRHSPMTCRLCVPVSTQLPLVILVCSCGGFLCTLREPMVSHELSCSSLLFPVKLNLPFTSSYSNSSTNLLHCASSSALSDTASYFNYE